MVKLIIVSFSKLNRDILFNLSTDIEKFPELFPKYFKSFKITESKNGEILVTEKLSFLGKNFETKTKHIIKKPNTHEIYLLDGPLCNSSFLEFYNNYKGGTKITIKVNLKFRKIYKIFSIFSIFIKWKVNKIMDEFLQACEQKMSI